MFNSDYVIQAGIAVATLQIMDTIYIATGGTIGISSV
jgi:hypothetical protein